MGCFLRGFHMNDSRLKSPVDRVVLTQFIATVIATLVILIVDWVAAYSAFFGGMSSVIPGALALARVRMATRQESVGGTESAESIKPVLQGELWKFAASIAMFTMVFVLVKPLAPEFFFGAFVAVHLLYAVVPYVEAKRLRSMASGK